MKAVTKLILCLFIVGISGLLVYPYETTVVPDWRVRVVDENGNPVSGVTVTEYWRHMSFESDDHHAEAITDYSGYVSFPGRTTRAPLIRRAIGSLINRLNVHRADFGPHA